MISACPEVGGSPLLSSRYNSKTRPRLRSRSQSSRMIPSNALSLLAFICLSNAAVSASTLVDAAFTGLAVKNKRPATFSSSSATTTRTGTSNSYSQVPVHTSLLVGFSSLPCFHFAKDRNLEKKEHYNDALLNRIISGRTSSSSRWRKRTKRAAAALGIQRQHITEQDYIDEQEQRYQDMLSTRPTVPPLSSTIFRSELGDQTSASASTSTSNPSNLRVEKLGSKLQITTYTKKRRKLTQEQHAQAKLDWAAKYTSLHTLRQNLGRNKNRIWGDFDNKTTRKLYHTLLPRALLGLYEVGLFCPTDLAPLAFEARVAAKKYARERCVLPGRVAAMVYDGFRSWRTWGTWSVEGMSWEQVWNKYETQILEEYMEDHAHVDIDDLQEEITAQICLRILERSCITNEAVDKMFLEESENKPRARTCKRNAERDLARIKIKLERDIEELSETNRQLQLVNFDLSKHQPQFLLDVIGGSLPASLPLPSLFHNAY